jgi:hypothetical protein
MEFRFSSRDTWRLLWHMPRAVISLRAADAESENDPFYARLVRDFYAAARRRHRKFPLVRALEWGVALCPLTGRFDDYSAQVESSARRNYRKATRLGYTTQRVVYNERLDDIAAIWRSTDVRQGEMPADFRDGKVQPCHNPPSRSPLHDYPYLGVLKDGRLVAYAGCLVCGDLCMIEQIFGHADFQADGVVPMLIVDVARHVCERHPSVRWYGYGTFFGAGRSMRRFKRKFGFAPHRVLWRRD